MLYYLLASEVLEFADSSRVGGEREICINRCVIVGYLWAICGQRGREREREREGDGRGREREGEGEEEEGGRVLWALGGNLCLAFEGWGSYNHPFVTSGKR